MTLLFPLLAVRGITFGAPTFLFALLALAGIAFAVVVYRQTLPPVSPWRKRTLSLLRAVVLVLVLFVIFEPVLSWINRTDKRGQVLLLVDRSASMEISDGGTVRDSLAKSFLRRSGWQDLQSRGSLRTFAFGDSARSMSLDSIRSSSADWVGTNPGDAWLAALKASAGDDVGAIVLISDGAQNEGPNPERLASEINVPIYTVGVGDTTLRRDAIIADILTNDIAYRGAQVPIRVRVRGSGLSGTSGRLRVMDSQSRTLSDEVIQFEGSLFEKTVETSFLADKEGELRLSAVLDSLPGEATVDNNRRSRIVRVLDSKYNVLVLAGAPSPDVTFLMQALGRDTTISASALVETRSGFAGGKSGAMDLVADAELIVLVNYPTTASNSQVLNAVALRLTNDGIPLLYVGGPAVSKVASEKFAARLPFEWSPKGQPDRVVVRGASSHPALSAGGELGAPWADLPPIFGSAGSVEPKASATVVATVANEVTPELPSGPALLISDLNRRRTAAFTVFDIYRWQLGRAKESVDTDFYSNLMSRLTAWLLAPTEEKQVKISTDKKVYSSGESVRFQAQVYGADLKPVNGASVLVGVTGGEREETVSLRDKGNGLYEGQMTASTSGDYAYSGFALTGADTLGKDKGAFVVESFNLEWLDSRARYDVLQAISRNSGGAFFTTERSDSLFEKLNLPSKVVESAREIPLWNRPLLLWILIGLLGLEWLLRKRSGML